MALPEFELKFSCKKELPPLSLIRPKNLLYSVKDPSDQYDRYAYYTPHEPFLETTELKISFRYRLRLNDIGLSGDLVAALRNLFPDSCECHEDHLVPVCNDENLVPGLWFACKICGKGYVCECFRPAHEIRFGRALSRFTYRREICHLCRRIPSDMSALHPMYGSQVRVRYEPYVEKNALIATGSADSTLDKTAMKNAENEIRDLIGVPRIGEGWVAEMDLLNLVRSCFPNTEVIHQASPPWLGRQRIDIFIPARRVAIEYQGKQHFEPIDFFGGEEGFRMTLERDERKKRLCEENDIRVVYFSYNEKITKKKVRTRIENA